MSFTQAIINQVGREIGRDLYKQFKSKSINETDIYDNVKNFTLSAYDKVTIRQFTNIVNDPALEISDGGKDLHNIFQEIDSKIDYLKENLDSIYMDKLNELDKTNLLNYVGYLSQNLAYTDKTIEKLEFSIEKYKAPNKLLLRLTNFWLFVWISISLLLSYNYDFFNILPGHWLFWILQIFIIGGCGITSFFNRESKISKIIKSNLENISNLENMKKYKKNLETIHKSISEEYRSIISSKG